MDVENLVRDGMPFLSWLVDWKSNLRSLDWNAECDDPTRVGMFSVDVTSGFCYEGPLSSPRVAAIVPPIVRLFERAHSLGVRNFVLVQDAHLEDAVEFGSFPPHCVRGSPESETVPELMSLPFFDQFTLISKNSISSSIGTELPGWLDAHPDVSTFVVVGDCTDLCTYQLAMYLRLRANAVQRSADRIIVPVDCVDTYDLAVPEAADLGAFPHHGDLLHLIFLYSMALNGVEDLFDVYTGANEVAEGKPEPDMILETCRRAGVDPSDSVYVGDELVDAIAGTAAGVAGVIMVDHGPDVSAYTRYIVDSVAYIGVV